MPPIQARQEVRHGLATEDVELAILEVAQPWREAEAKHRKKPEDLVGGAARVRVVLGDAQPGAVLEQPSQHVRRLGRGRRDDFGVEGAELVGDVGVERDAGLVAVPGVDVAEQPRPGCPRGKTARPSWRRAWRPAGHTDNAKVEHPVITMGWPATRLAGSSPG